jgi:hypothetical protein
MHPQQKAAWFTLTVIGGTVVLYLASIPVFSWWFHRTWAQAAGPALGVFGLVGLTGFTQLFYRVHGGRPSKEPMMDERDHQLSRRAWGTGMRTFWLTFGLAGMGAWAYLYYVLGFERVTVPVGIFPGMIYADFIIFLLAQSLATLHFYGWTTNGR